MTVFFIFNVNMVCYTFPIRVLINIKILYAQITFRDIWSYLIFIPFVCVGMICVLSHVLYVLAFLMSILMLLAPPSSSMRVYENERVFQDLFRAHLGPFQRYIRLL